MNNVAVYICCGGKCGSSTLYNTFKNYYDSIHVHDFFYYDNSSLKNLIEKNKYIYNKIYIIDSYRTPIERKISSFFQNIDYILPDWEKMSISEIITFYNTYMFDVEVLNSEEYHPINDVLQYYKLPPITEFNYDSRYIEICHENIHIIKLRFKDIKYWDCILTNIFNTPIELINENLSENKPYNTTYKKFMEEYRVPETYLYTQLIKDDQFKIYNTEKEQIEYYKFWSSRTMELSYELPDEIICVLSALKNYIINNEHKEICLYKKKLLLKYIDTIDLSSILKKDKFKAR
jgi:hypothetical protein